MNALLSLLDLVVDEDTMVTSGRGRIALMGVVYVSYRSGEVLSRVYPVSVKDRTKLCCAPKWLTYSPSSL